MPSRRPRSSRSAHVTSSNDAGDSVWLRPALVWAALAFAVLLCYASTLNHAFVYDDVPYILQNGIVQEEFPVWQAFTRPYPPHQPHLSLYRPLPQLISALNWQIGLAMPEQQLPGLPRLASPWPFHATNLLLHWAVCLAMFYVWMRLGARREAAFAAALLFAVHPVRVENVAALAGVVDLWSVLFALGAVWCWVRARGERHYLQPWRLGAAACFLLALFSKENAIVIPLLLIAIRLFLPDQVSQAPPSESPMRSRLRSLVLELLPLAAVLALYMTLRVYAIGELAMSEKTHYFKADETALRLRSIPIIFLLNLKLSLWPVELCADYNYPIRFLGDWFLAAPASWANGWVIAGMVAMALYGAALAWLWRRHRLAALGLAWYGLALLPTSQLIPFGDLMGERFLYLPSVGLCFAAATVVIDLLWPRLKFAPRCRTASRHIAPAQWGIMIMGVAVIGLLAARTLARTEAWSSPRALWLTLQRDAPDNREAWYGFAFAIGEERTAALARGNALAGAGHDFESERWLDHAAALEDEAIAAYEEVIRRTPDYLTAYLNLANLLIDGRRPDRERAHALLMDMMARAGDRHEFLYTGWGRIGQMNVDDGRWADARDAFARALRFRETPELLVLLGVAHAETGDLAAAEAVWRRALALDPANANALVNLRKLQSHPTE